jgi:hypothetical protein
MSKLTDRFSSPTPKFWKDIQKKALMVFALSAIFLGGEIVVNDTTVAFTLPKVIQTILEIVSVGSAITAFVAQFTVEYNAES